MPHIGVSFRTEKEDIDMFDKVAQHIYRQNRAGALRLAVMEINEKYRQRIMDAERRIKEQEEQDSANSIFVPKPPTPTKKPVQADYSTTDQWGAPNTCPVCGAMITTEQGISHPALAIIKSGSDWGTWACHACYSAGKWYEAMPFEITDNKKLENLSLSLNKE